MMNTPTAASPNAPMAISTDFFGRKNYDVFHAGA